MRKWIFIVAIVATLIPAAARAQAPATPTNDASNVDDIRKNARMHVGPFYFTPALLLKEAGVDSNVFNQPINPKSDFTATVTPQADIAITFARRGLLTTTVGSDLVYYQKYSSERSIDPAVRVRGEAYAHRLTFFADDSYLNTRQRPNFEVDLRTRHLENDAQAGIDLRLTPKFSVELAARRALTEYDADAVFAGTSLQQTLNRDTSGIVGTIRHKITALTTIAVRFDRLEDVFTYSPERDSRSYRITPGLVFKPRALINGSAWVGYRKFTPDQPLVLPQFSGLVADLGLSYTLLGATTFGVSYHRDLTYSYEVDNPFFVDNSVGASIRRALGGRLDTIVSIDRHTYDYEQLLTVPASPLERADTTWVYGANIGYRVRRDTRLGFGGRYYQRDSTAVRFVEYDGLRLGVTVNYGF
jgi:hypothetical protein